MRFTQGADSASGPMITGPEPRPICCARRDAADRICLPEVDQAALAGLKFSEALPERLATATLAARLADVDSAARVLVEPVRFSWSDSLYR